MEATEIARVMIGSRRRDRLPSVKVIPVHGMVGISDHVDELIIGIQWHFLRIATVAVTSVVRWCQMSADRGFARSARYCDCRGGR